MIGKNKFTKILAVLLSMIMIYIPTVAYAAQTDPDDSLAINGKITYLGKGIRAPFRGVLFDIVAATKLKLDKQFAKQRFQLELKLQKGLLTSEFTLKLGVIQAKYDALQGKHTSLLKIKNQEITRLQDLVKKNPNDHTHWWFAGGVIAGILLSIGIFFAATEISK